MRFVSTLLALLFALASFAFSQPVSISGTVNAFRPVTEMGCDWVNVNIATDFSPGDRVLVIQMKGAELDLTNSPSFGSIVNYRSAGLFEFATISSISGGIVFFTQRLTNLYEVSGQVQLVRVAAYSDAHVTGNLIIPAFELISGGVLVLEVEDTLILDADITANGKGFSGEFRCTNPDGGCGIGYPDYFYAVTSGFGAEKGEGIALVMPGFDGGRGAWANGGGGGNKHNSGGGGGGNFSAGGKGGFEANFCPAADIGGVGGRILDYTDGRIFLGGGGGSGDHNNGVSSAGANGGGIIIIRCGTLIGNGRLISANGDEVSFLPNGIGDGTGGGGAGGTILLDVANYVGSVNVSVNGGDGGDQQTTYPACFGTGGGGGTGVLLLTGAALPAAISLSAVPGQAGTDLLPSSSCFGTTYGAEPGDNSTGFALNFPISEASGTISGTFLPPDTVLCPGESLVLNAPLSADSVFWSDGSTGPSLTVNTGGSYSAIVFEDGCAIFDTVLIAFLSPSSVLLGPDRTLCHGDTAFLSVPGTGLDVLWSTGDTTDTLAVTAPGTYFVQVSNGACTGFDTITFLPDSIRFFSLGNDTTACDIALVLRSNLVADSYLWSTGDTTDTLAIDEDGTYWLLVTLAGCQRTDSITVTQRSDTATVFIPNVFTPNGDGVMDQYCITAEGELLWYELHLYDRNGQLILTTRDPDYCWDGNFNGTPVPDGVYFITLTTNSSCNPDEMVHHGGTVTVLR